MNVHLQYYSKNVGNIQNNFKRVVEKIDHCEDDIGLLQQGQTNQETFNQAILERMREMETKIEGQTERIISLEEEVATLHWKKACMCGEGKGKGIAIASSSRDQEEQSKLEYAEEEGSSSSASYHIPLVAPGEPLLVFGSPVSQTLPSEVQETCGCPVPAVVRIEDDMEMTVVPRENKEAIPIQVERPPAYTVDLQRSSRSRTLAHYRSSTCHTNRHAKQLGSHPYRHPPLDIQFPCARELLIHTNVLTSRQGRDQESIGHSAGPLVDTSFIQGDADGGSLIRTPAYSPDSTCYHPCSPDCGENCLGGSSDPC